MKKMAGALAFCCFLFIINGKAQLRTAIAGGAQISSVPGNSNTQWDTLNHSYSSRKGFHIGLLAEAPFFKSSSLYFRTGMIYINKGRNYSSSFDTVSSTLKGVNGSQFVNYMEVPVNILFKTDLGKKSRLVIGGGPYISFLFSGKEVTSIRYSSGDVDNIENTSLKVPRSQGHYKNVDMGVNAFAGVEFGRLFVNADFSKGLTDFYNTHDNTGSFKHQVVGATVGFYLSSEKKREAKKRDRDKDGIPDIEDKCPFQKGDPHAGGCPDKDGDGVGDSDDACPNLPGPAHRKGCPAPDSDKDGVNDDEDKCPDEKGTIENHGCPEIDVELKTAIEGYAKRIQFKYKSSELSDKSKEVLNEVVKLLKKNPKLNVLIEGYTSNDGRNHKKISQSRADAVKDYLETKGIKAKRLTAFGFGDTNPLNKGKTEAERALNRRVELKIVNY
jgi:outer membrane protein OmpA-like peptidoglycan-associated protein